MKRLKLLLPACEHTVRSFGHHGGLSCYMRAFARSHCVFHVGLIFFVAGARSKSTLVLLTALCQDRGKKLW